MDPDRTGLRLSFGFKKIRSPLQLDHKLALVCASLSPPQQTFAWSDRSFGSTVASFACKHADLRKSCRFLHASVVALAFPPPSFAALDINFDELSSLLNMGDSSLVVGDGLLLAGDQLPITGDGLPILRDPSLIDRSELPIDGGLFPIARDGLPITGGGLPAIRD